MTVDVDEELATAQRELLDLRRNFRFVAGMCLVAMVGAGGSLVLQLWRLAGLPVALGVVLVVAALLLSAVGIWRRVR